MKLMEIVRQQAVDLRGWGDGVSWQHKGRAILGEDCDRKESRTKTKIFT